jgi:hypothetical protein
MQISRRVHRRAARMAFVPVAVAGVLGPSALAANATVVPIGSTEINGLATPHHNYHCV